jgi:PAS domain S-box-containing protein
MVKNSIFNKANLVKLFNLHLPFWVAVVGFTFTVLFVQFIKEYERRSVGTVFNQRVQEITFEIKNQFIRPVYGLNGAKAAFHSNKGLGKAGFQRYVESRDFEAEFPGVRAFAWVERVAAQKLQRFVEATRADDALGFQVRQLDEKDYEIHYIVRYIEPLIFNMPARGLDVGSHPERRRAIEAAGESGLPQMSAPLQLVQNQQSKTGVLINIPVYASPKTPETAEERKAQFLGVMNAVATTQDLLERSPLLSSPDLDVAVEIHDVTDTLIGASPAFVFITRTEKPSDPAYATTSRLNLYGRELEISAHSTPKFEKSHTSLTPYWTFLFGMCVTAWLTYYVYQQQRRWRIENEAKQKRSDDSVRMQTISNHLTNAVVFTNTHGLITWSNEGFEALSGYAMHEVLGKKPAKLLRCAATNALEAAQLDAAQAAQKGYVCELLNQSKDGRMYWVEIRCIPLFDDAGKHTGYLEFIRDVSSRHAQALALESLALQNESLVNGLDQIAAVSVTDPRGVIIHANDLFCDISGYSQDELRGQTHALVNAGKDSVTDWSEVWLTIKSGKTWHGEICNRNKSGALYWFDCLISPFKNSKGEIEKFVSIRFDITQAKLAMQEVSTQKALMYNAIDILGQAFCMYDAEDRLVYFNEQYVEIYAASQAAITLGATFEDIVRYGAERGQYVDAIGRVDAWVAERVAAHQSANNSVIQKLQDGRVLKILERRLPSGHIVGFRIDITEQMQAIETAEKANDIKGVFLANMSHEIRTPMNGVLGMLQLLKKTSLTTQQTDYTNHAMGAAKLLLGLLNDILDSSKINAGQLQLEQHAFCLDEVMRDLALVMSASTVLSVEVLIDIDTAAHVRLMGDSLRLYQVLLNLCSNAIKFTQHGHVLLRASTRAMSNAQLHVEFEVIDTGMGMSEAFLSQVFEPFTQAHASINRRFGGTGLGLNLSHNLVKLMGGALNVESTLNQGSRFFFDVVFQRDTTQQVELPTRTTDQNAKQVHALMVKENAEARELMAQMGTRLGWQVSTCGSGSAALEELKHAATVGSAFDVVFMDCQMEGHNGWQTAAAIRQTQDATPIVMLATPRCVTYALDHGIDENQWVNATLLKPVTASMLNDALMNVKGYTNPTTPSAVHDTDAPLLGFEILLVEDNLINQKVGQDLLMTEGANVTLADNGLKAIEMLEVDAHRFDVVLMDMQMPVLDGLSATRAIREDLGLTELAIIAMTANAMVSDREACLEAGMNDHVSKPLLIDDLVETILSQRPTPRSR